MTQVSSNYLCYKFRNVSFLPSSVIWGFVGWWCNVSLKTQLLLFPWSEPFPLQGSGPVLLQVLVLG